MHPCHAFFAFAARDDLALSFRSHASRRTNGTLRALEPMRLYRDRPMDLADASLVALAETAGYTRIFSIDSDFYVYRLADGSALEVVPGPLKSR